MKENYMKYVIIISLLFLLTPTTFFAANHEKLGSPFQKILRKIDEGTFDERDLEDFPEVGSIAIYTDRTALEEAVICNNHKAIDLLLPVTRLAYIKNILRKKYTLDEAKPTIETLKMLKDFLYHE